MSRRRRRGHRGNAGDEGAERPPGGEFAGDRRSEPTQSRDSDDRRAAQDRRRDDRRSRRARGREDRPPLTLVPAAGASDATRELETEIPRRRVNGRSRLSATLMIALELDAVPWNDASSRPESAVTSRVATR